jgi:hypothetical protein
MEVRFAFLDDKPLPPPHIRPQGQQPVHGSGLNECFDRA